MAMAPDDAYIRDSLGWVLFKQGEMQQAREVLKDAFEKRPDADIAAHLGEVLWKLGDQTKARAIWQEGLKLDAKDEVLLRTMQEFGVKPAP